MRKRSSLMLMCCVMVVFSLTAVAVFSQVNLNGQNNTNWKVYNAMPATKSFWDINKATVISGGHLQFPIQTFLTDFSTNKAASFVVYLLATDNSDITGKTFSTNVNWTSGTYKTRSTAFSGAYVRFEFQDVTSGPYDANDYWWSTGSNSLDLNGTTQGPLTVPLTNPAAWSNLCGWSATDTTVPFNDCITGAQINISPAAGFLKAMKNVKEVGLSFGSSGSYASGVAIDGTPGLFTVNSFTIN